MAESAMPSKSAGNITQMAEQSTQSVESSPKSTDSLMDFIRALGYVPPEYGAHRNKAQQIRRFRNSGKFTEAQIEEIRAFQERRQESNREPPETYAPPDPLDPFAEEASNRLEQDLLMATSGMRTYKVMRRIQRYKNFFHEPALQENATVLQYKSLMQQAIISPGDTPNRGGYPPPKILWM